MLEASGPVQPHTIPTSIVFDDEAASAAVDVNVEPVITPASPATRTDALQRM